ncbi:helix-turn-helix domain-containing protein [Undibacterium oligocarboniphilum]|uniref:Helix-turn-helix domain-containing protein n=1 Tax=Undibacterium oligocarboniphilum TaxID=666702 RepID=A0A850QL10_9BURK|nr:helix-turn-helix domain-containing protein [Undibacterium oligocarboniphilum]MBC3870234.1 helix-turn-helix domain-containing protein [Undibacterium oligocarboniphilum]NVO78225.1 helix-turn-helix domain-containing protein [Undibacterium oligocarboniphilum]
MSDAGLKQSSDAVSDESGNKPVLSVVQTAGAQLAAARVQAGMSVEQVAEHLKLSVRQIAALENNEFERLPKLVIVRGFVRSYAKLLKLDPSSVIASLPAENNVQALDDGLRPTLATPFQESRTSFLGRSENNNRKYLIASACLALAAVLFVVIQRIEQAGYLKYLTQTSQTQTQTVTADSANDVRNPVLDAATTSSSLPVVEKVASALPLSQVQSALPTTPQVEPVIPESAVISKTSPEISSGTDNNTSVLQTSVSGAGNQLKLVFHQDSWVQVKKESGVVLTSHLAKAGTEEFFDLKDGPLQARLGNARGVSAWVRGNSMEIVLPKDSNVVNLSVK